MAAMRSAVRGGGQQLGGGLCTCRVLTTFDSICSHAFHSCPLVGSAQLR